MARIGVGDVTHRIGGNEGLSKVGGSMESTVTRLNRGMHDSHTVSTIITERCFDTPGAMV